MDNLKPCHCGSPNIEAEHHNSIFAGQRYRDYSNSDGWRARCSACGSQTCWWHTKEEMETAWNTRPLEDKLITMVEAMIPYLRHEGRHVGKDARQLIAQAKGNTDE